MKAAVIGLGVEGKKAVNSFKDHGWSIYATDSNCNIDLNGIEIPIVDMEISIGEEMSIVTEDIQLDIGYTNNEEISKCDAIAISPSMWGSEFVNSFKDEGKLLCDVLTRHKDLLTIGITGTNGKTTTVHMMKDILENAGYNVLVGGNAGGGFNGYYDLILEAEYGDYDILLVEVCDMTLDFARYCFDFDILGLTNIGNDHMDVHGTVANYKNTLVRFFEGKDIVIAHNQDFKSDFIDASKNFVYSSEYPFDLNIFGRFNKFNAGLAYAITRELKIPKEIIIESLSNFKPVSGRMDVYKINDSKIYVGKTDNTDALAAVLKEDDFYAVFMGTPRFSEIDRVNMLEDVVNYNPEVIVLFPGLDNTLDLALNKIKSLNYKGRLEIVNSLDEIIALVAEFSHENAMFIGGNGQEVIINIQERIKLLSEKLE